MERMSVESLVPLCKLKKINHLPSCPDDPKYFICDFSGGNSFADSAIFLPTLVTASPEAAIN